MRQFVILALLPLAACSAPQAIQLRDPAGHVAECKADPWAVYSWDIPRWQEDCAKRYERNGFTRLH